MTKQNIRILHRILAIAFIVTAVLACASVVVVGILSMTNTAPLAAEKIASTTWLFCLPVMLFCFICLGTAVVSFVWPVECFFGKPSFDARYEETQVLIGKKMYEPSLLVPFDKYDQYLNIWKISIAGVSGVSLIASLICIRNHVSLLQQTSAAYYADVVGIILPLSLYTLTALVFCLAGRLVLNGTMQKGIAYASALLKLRVADRPEILLQYSTVN